MYRLPRKSKNKPKMETVKLKAEDFLLGFDDDQPYFRWTPNCTRMMLELRFERQEQFKQRQRQKKELWNEIAAEMHRRGNYVVTGDGCDLKYRNMLQTYKKNALKEERGQQTFIMWEFYDMFKQAMKNDGVGMEEELLPSMLCESMCADDESIEEVNGHVERERTTEDEDAQVLSAGEKHQKRQRLSSTQSQAVPNSEQKPYMERSNSHSDLPTISGILPSNVATAIHRDTMSPAWLGASEMQECRVFGESVGLQLAHVVPPHTRALLQLKIQELLYLAKTERLN